MKHFKTQELVPREVYEILEEDSLKLFDPKVLELLDNIREILGVPLICNNWEWGGSRNYCGYRQPSCLIGAKKSAHKQGKAFDLISIKMSAAEMREMLSKNQDKLLYPIRVEKYEGDKEISWLHFDILDTKGQKIYFFKA